MDKTIDYYNSNASEFVSGTKNVDFTEVQDIFMDLVPRGSRILDFGCGSGRDTLVFLSQGYDVEATDGSAELCSLASEYTGIDVKCQLFNELDEIDRYDGIWACASILHLHKDEIPHVLGLMKRAVREAGYIYMSFKYGDFEGEVNGRYFTYLTEKSMGDILGEVCGLDMIKEWISEDVREDKAGDKWLNVIVKKNTV